MCSPLKPPVIVLVIVCVCVCVCYCVWVLVRVCVGICMFMCVCVIVRLWFICINLPLFQSSRLEALIPPTTQLISFYSTSIATITYLIDLDATCVTGYLYPACMTDILELIRTGKMLLGCSPIWCTVALTF